MLDWPLCLRTISVKVFSYQASAVFDKIFLSFFWGTDVSPFPNFNNSVLTTRRNLLLHC